MNKLKTAIKKKHDEIKGLQEQLTGIKNFVSQSEHQFIKALTPQMVKVDPTYKLNKQKLLRDIRILRKFYHGKIPAETTNDAEQLHITLSKCKQTLEQVIGDVAVYGIQQYEQSHSKESSAVNLNVIMSVSPQDNKSTVTNSCFMGDNIPGQTSVLQSGKPIQLDKLQKVEGKKTSHKRRKKLDFKQKRKHTKRKHNFRRRRKVSPKPKVVLVPAAMMVGAI